MKIKVSGKPVKVWINGVLCYLSAIRSAPIPPSPTGPLTWYTVDIPVSDSEFLAFGDGKFVVASGWDGTQAAYSSDCKNWTMVESFPGEIENFEYLNNKFISVSRRTGKDVAIYSENGINWYTQEQTFSTADLLGSAAYGNEKYIFVGFYYPDQCITSNDGIIWERLTLPATRADGYRTIRFLNNNFIAIGYGGDITYSKDGLNWVNPYFIKDNFYPTDITYNGSKYCILSGDTVGTSTNLLDWNVSPISTGFPYVGIRNISKANGLYVAVCGSNDEPYLYSYDGETWYALSTGQNLGYKKIVYGNGMFAALGEGKISYAYWPTEPQEYSSLVDHAITDKSKTASVVPTSSSIGEASIGTATIA